MAIIEINKNPTRRELRQFAAIWFPIFFAIVGTIVYRKSDNIAIPCAIWGIAVTISIVGFVFPRFMRVVYLGWIYAALPIGLVMSHVVLAAVYYLVMTPIGLALRLLRPDPLSRRFDKSAKSYWVRHNPAEDMERYFRQF